MTKRSTKGLAEFEVAHGQPKLARIQKELEVERAKVAALAGTRDDVYITPSSSSNTLRFAVIGDTQFGSLYSCPENLDAFYKRAIDFGCEHVLHAGDVLEGWKVYKGQEFELRDVGFEAQVRRFAEAAPHIGVDTLFITGNHDASFKKQIGVDVGAALSAARPDWKCVGADQGTVKLRTKEGTGYVVGLYHLGGGTSYAMSYRVQKAVESWEGGRKPQMACFGHFHKAEFIPAYRNVSILQTGTFQWQTPFMASMPSAAHVGGWLVSVQPGPTWNAVTAEFIAFYR